MANIAVNDMALVTVVGQYLGQTTMNTYPYVANTVTGTVTVSAGLGALNTALLAGGALYQTQRECCPLNWTNSENWIQIIRPIRYRKFTFIGAGAGLFDDTALTANLQGSIERYSEETGRHEQGAVRIPIGTGPNVMTAGLLEPDQVATLEEHAEVMKFVVTAGGVTWWPVTGVTAFGYTPLRIFGTSVKPTVRVIRRRTVGLGI